MVHVCGYKARDRRRRRGVRSSIEMKYVACQASDGSWAVSRTTATWLVAPAACGLLGLGYEFSVPTNSQDNEALKAAKAGIADVWLNASDRKTEGQWQAN